MTDVAFITRQPSLFETLVRRLIDWMNEPVVADTPLQFSSSDWADLPVHHPIRDGKGGR